jgi:hypothetical protein
LKQAIEPVPQVTACGFFIFHLIERSAIPANQQTL